MNNMFWKQNVNSIIALAGVAAVGIGAAYIIIRVASATEFSYVSTNESYIFKAEIHKDGGIDVSLEEE